MINLIIYINIVKRKEKTIMKKENARNYARVHIGDFIKNLVVQFE